jgi:peptide-methionine (S)-S-oxide reductase
MRKQALKVAFLACAAVLVLSAASFPDPPAERSGSGTTVEKVVLAGGCFWGMEGIFESLKGVSNVVSGYSGGSKETAHYEMTSSGMTGHAESVEITFDPAKISFGQLLKVFFSVAHDPTELNRQGPDEGTQYRSVIFYATPEQRQVAEEYIKRLNDAKVYRSKIVTQVVPLRAFYPAEDYHQHFMARNPYYPYIVYNDRPKMEALRQRFPDLLKSQSAAAK